MKTSPDPHQFSLTLNEDCPTWEKEIPVNSLVAVHFTADSFVRWGITNFRMNLLIITILALPADYAHWNDVHVAYAT